MAAFDYANCVVHLRADNPGSSTILDQINGTAAWTFAGAAAQTSLAPIAGTGSFDITDNDDTQFIRSTNAAVLGAFAFSDTEDWCIRFKYRAYNWTNYYAAVLGSGPGAPVVTFLENGARFGSYFVDWELPAGVSTPGTDHEIELSRVGGRLYAFCDGVALNPGGDAYVIAWPAQPEWFICHQPHAPEFFDGWVDEVQVFKGVGGHTAAYTAAINTPFPGATAGASGALGWTEADDVAAMSGTVVAAGAAAWTEANDGMTAAGLVQTGGSAVWTETNDINAAAGSATAASASGAMAWVEDDDTAALTGVSSATPARASVEVVQTVGRTIRHVTHEPLLQRILRARREERVKPAKERAAKRAKVIEVKAAYAALEGAGDDTFQELLREWVAQRPVLKFAEEPPQAFMAQVAFRIQQLQAEQEAIAAIQAAQREEEAVLALLFA